MIKLTGTVMMRRPLCLLLLVLALCCSCLSAHATFEAVNSDALTFGHLRAVMAEEGSEGAPGGKGDGAAEQHSSKEEAKGGSPSPQRNESETPKESQSDPVREPGTSGSQDSQKTLAGDAQNAQQQAGAGKQEKLQTSGDGGTVHTPTHTDQKGAGGPPVPSPTVEDGTRDGGKSPDQAAQEESKVNLPGQAENTPKPAEPAAPSPPSPKHGQPENTTPTTVQKTDNTTTDVRGTDPSHTPEGTQSVEQQQSEEHVPSAAEQSAGTTAAQPNDNAAAETAQSGSQAGADRTAPGTTVSHQTSSQENNPNMTRTAANPNEEGTNGGVTNSTKDTSAVTAAVSDKNVSNVTGGEDGSGIVRVWMHTPLMLLLFFITALSLTGL